jgi:hypothetical protein
MRKYNPRAYHRGGTVRTQMQENFIYNPTNITGQPVEPRGQSTRAIVKLYLSLTLMRRRQYITLLGTSFNAATDRKDRGLYRKSITLPLLPYLSLQSTSFHSQSRLLNIHKTIIFSHNVFLSYTSVFSGSICRGSTSRRCACRCRLQKERISLNLQIPWSFGQYANRLHTPRSIAHLAIADTASTVIYYDGPATSRTSPKDIGVVSEPAKKWEGVTRKTDLSGAKFTSSITAGAAALAKSEIAGSAKLGNEDFVCFVDGSSTFAFREGLLGLRETNCKADYWCASTDVGS